MAKTTKKKKIVRKIVKKRSEKKTVGKVAKEVVEKALMDGKARNVEVIEKSGAKGWIRFPRWPDWLRFFSIIASIGLAIGGFLLIVKFWRFLELGILLYKQTYSINQLLILSWLVLEYVLISLPFICFCAWWKKGFLNLKGFGKGALIFLLIVCLAAGLVIWLIVGLIFGLIICLADGLVGWLISWSIICLIACLAIGLIFGLIEELS